MNFPRFLKKKIVEDGVRFSLKALGLVLADGKRWTTTWGLPNNLLGSLECSVKSEGKRRVLHVLGWVYSRHHNSNLELTSTRCNFGGRRFWFVCPLTNNGIPCRRRAFTLHLPPGGQYFGCRLCHRLTYRSSQTHNQRLENLRKDRGALERLLKLMEG